MTICGKMQGLVGAAGVRPPNRRRGLTAARPRSSVRYAGASKRPAREQPMDLIADRGRRGSVEGLHTSRRLAHPRQQADQRNRDDLLIADVDSHHYENEVYDEFLPFIENEVLRQLVMAGRTKGRQTLMPTQVSFQDMGGRITRYPMRSTEKTAGGKP